MRQPSGLFPILAAFLGAALFAASVCPPLNAQRGRPDANPFPDDDEIGTTRARSFSVSGTVTDAQSGARLDGVRVDLQSFSEGVLATAFTSNNGNFQFNNIRQGDYELIFDQTGYNEMRENLQVEGPVFGMLVNLRKLNAGPAGAGSTVSVRELSIPLKAREAMNKGLALLYQKSDYPGSIKQFQHAIDIFPTYYEAYAQIGLAYMKMKDTTRAEEALRKSIEVSKEQYAEAYALLASLLYDQNRLSDAEASARKAVQVNPNSWQAQSELAQVLYGLKQAEEAEAHGQAAVKLQPANPALYLLLADIHIALENGRALLDDLNHYLKLAPDGPYAAQARLQRDQLQQELQSDSAEDGAPAGPAPAVSPTATVSPAAPASTSPASNSPETSGASESSGNSGAPKSNP